MSPTPDPAAATTSRVEVLSRVRRALGSAERPPTEVPRGYRTESSRPQGDPALVDVLVDRLVDYRAGVRRTAAADLPAAIAEAVATGVARRAADPPEGPLRVVVPPGLAPSWVEGLGDAVVLLDDGLGTAALDGCDVVVTAAALAIAETGTIVLDASPDQGRRALTLVPDVHVCVVAADQVVGNVPDAMPRLAPSRALTWISGPSATSDIELDRVEGVHGPRILEVVVVST